ncbi:hypothetical protein V1517DRAFT_328292 [Lipomyces orientalis]|uniref:Uncharacterized protein n=1 Tax=Lipomyces orientalis TaxID=1233043 RepID=A0ACC3TIP5_9ASCO
MSLWLFLIGGLFWQYGEPTPILDQPYTWIVVGNSNATRSIQACCYLAIATFAVARGPISWIYPPEIVPLRIRAKSVSLVLASNWTANFGLEAPPLSAPLAGAVPSVLSLSLTSGLPRLRPNSTH